MFNLLVIFSTVTVALAACNDGTRGSSITTFNNPLGIIYYLYTRDNPTSPDVITDKSSLCASHFSEQRPTRFLVHGASQDYSSSFVQDIKVALLTKNDLNVVAVDWSAVSGFQALQVALVGANLATFIQLLESEKLAPLYDMEIIGYGLGAHVAGNAGKQLNYGIPRILGLNIGLNVPYGDRLQPSDAQYVEVAHTSAQLSGTMERLGHADMYFNGGWSQPGCSDDACSSYRSVLYFIESLSTLTGLVGTHCQGDNVYTLTSNGCDWDTSHSKVFGGEPLNMNAKGVYYIETNSQSPFAKPYTTPQ